MEPCIDHGALVQGAEGQGRQRGLVRCVPPQGAGAPAHGGEEAGRAGLAHLRHPQLSPPEPKTCPTLGCQVLPPGTMLRQPREPTSTHRERPSSGGQEPGFKAGSTIWFWVAHGPTRALSVGKVQPDAGCQLGGASWCCLLSGRGQGWGENHGREWVGGGGSSLEESARSETGFAPLGGGAGAPSGSTGCPSGGGRTGTELGLQGLGEERGGGGRDGAAGSRERMHRCPHPEGVRINTRDHHEPGNELRDPNVDTLFV